MTSATIENKSSERLIVSLVDANLPLHHGQTLPLSKLALGASSTPSVYVQVPRQGASSSTGSGFSVTASPSTYTTTLEDASHHLCEIQSLPADFGSFLVTPHHTIVGKDSNLYLTTAVDPLFLLLQHNDNESVQKWQPWDQIVSSCLDDTARAVLPADRNQLMHLFARMPVSDDEVYYKFSVSKTLTWLQAKWERVQAMLLRQQKHSGSAATSSTTSSVASNFHMGQQATTTTTSDAANEAAKRQAALRQERLVERCRAEALQIVCDYLNETWKARFLTHVNASESSLLPDAVKRDEKRAANDTAEVAVPSAKKAKPSKTTSKPTLGQKKLAKVNTKGMQKMSAFFGLAVKKENSPQNKK